jgi:GNAT superfamily N-acetyltransferase
LETVAHEFPTGPVVDQLRQAVRTGKVLLLLRDSPQGNFPGKLIGFTVCERGAVVYITRHRFNLSPKWMFTHYSAVFPEYRGQGYAFELIKLSTRYAYQRGVTLFCGAVSVRNAPSLRAHLRNEYAKLVITVHHVALLGGKLAWTTPAHRVRDALLRVAEGAEPAQADASETANRPGQLNS